MKSQFLLTTFLFLFCLLPFSSQAQITSFQNNLLDSSNKSTIEHDVYILVEADTYIPQFYKGRPEPTANNTMSLIAVTDLPNSTDLSYQWQIGNDHARTDEPRFTFTAGIGNQFLATVSVIDSTGATIARTSEYIDLSSPTLTFYEHNPLRAESRVAIGDDYTLTGDEVSIYAEPYFVGSLKNTVTNWLIDGFEQPVSDPFQLTILRPDTVPESVSIKLNTYNTARLSERIEAGFTLYFGI